MRGRIAYLGVALIASAVGAATLPAATQSRAARLVDYSFGGRLLAAPPAGANSLSLKVEAGNGRALKKLGRATPYQAFSVNASTVVLRRAKGRSRSVSIATLRAGDWLRIRVRASHRASLARIRATPARLVVDFGQQGRYADRTPPVIAASLAGIPGANGWYTSDVTVTWVVDDPESGIAARSGCGTTAIGETAGATITCSARNRIGVGNSRSVTVKVDKTPPGVTPAPSRPPDHNGWYTRPLTVAFTGTDATSGVSSCTSAAYGGPDNAAAVVSGSCTDHAGNTAAAGFALRYDATPPGKVSVLWAQAGNRAATLRWRAPADRDVASFVITRRGGPRRPGKVAERVVYDGGGRSFKDRGLANGFRYRYRVTSVDHAGNRSAPATTAVLPRKIYLLAPPGAARLVSPPLLRWLPRAGARYYNVQLFRGGRKILSAWPSRRALALRRQWRYRGRRYVLSPGRYRWYVWPGLGSRSKARYGRLLGKRSFVVVPAKRR